ncbi:MAG: diacylglycerol kinase family protein [Bacteroidetes bacterium]|nr:diacylglycerol kinase family protein [Bacteroidota bacterium]
MHKNKNILSSFKNAFRGFKSGIQGHRNIQIMLLSALVVVATGLYLNVNTTHWTILLLCISLVISLELMNTAIEKLLDHMHPDFHEAVGKAKDIAAAAVTFSCIISAVCGSIIFASYLL